MSNIIYIFSDAMFDSGRADYPGIIVFTEVPSHVDLAAGLNYKDKAL